MAAQTSWVWGVPVMPLERGVSRYDDLAGKRNFHRGLLKRATDFRMRLEIKVLQGTSNSVVQGTFVRS